MRKTTLLMALYCFCWATPMTFLGLATPGCGSGEIGGTNNNNTNNDPDAQVDDDGSANNNNADADVDGDVPEPCGNGIVEAPEECDDGTNNSNTTPNACRTDCTLPVCGDQVVDDQYNEVCDDGNNTDGDGCSADCRASRQIHGLGIDGTNFDIARDNNDNIHISWKDGQMFYYGRIENGAVVGQQTVATSGVFTRFAQPRLVARPDGQTVHTCWISPSPRGAILYHAWRNSAGVWVTETAWDAGGTNDRFAVPAIGVDLTGAVHVTAQRYVEGVSDIGPIVYLRKPDNGNWPATETEIHQPNGIQWRMNHIFTDRAGGIHATWKAYLQVGKYRYAASGDSLSDVSAVTIDIPKPSGHNVVNYGDTYVADNGDVHHGFLVLAADVWHAVKTNTSNNFVADPSHAGTLNDPEHYGSWPAIGVDPSGRILMAWAEMQGTGVLSFINLSIYNSGVWTQETISDTANNANSSKVAIAVSSDSTYVIWRESTAEMTYAVMRFAP